MKDRVGVTCAVAGELPRWLLRRIGGAAIAVARFLALGGIVAGVLTASAGRLVLRGARRVRQAVAWWCRQLLYGVERPDLWGRH